MLLHEGRSGTGVSPTLAEGWRVERLTPPSRLFGANGLRAGPDGRIYIAQVTGSQISALDVGSGRLETVSPKGGDIIAPDDVAFGPRGDLVRHRGDGRSGQRARRGRTHPGAARGCPVRQRHHRSSGPVVHRRMPRGRKASRARPRWWRAAGAAGQRSVAQRDGGRPRRPAVLPGDGRQRNLARSASTAAHPKRSPRVWACPIRSSSIRRARSFRPRCTAARCCASIRATASRRCWPI